ncbi:MAG: hypothetical protein OSJ62_15035 [Lachnospiraceae bacterium]|nr:hypothetical protein [Lachnospiraceae bacterium]
MKKQIITECKRAFFSTGMVTALLIGIGIVLWHQYQYVWNVGVEQYNIYCPESVFYKWIGASSFPMQSYLFYLILPILACLPAGTSYYEDLHSGYYIHIYTRNQKKEYLFAKYTAAFLSGGIAVVLPLVLSLYFTAMRFPMLAPEPIMGFGPNARSVGAILYYKHPGLHTLLFLGIDFIFAGGIAGITLLTTFFTNYKFTALITPFVCYYFVFSLDNLLGVMNFSPNYFLIPGFFRNTIWEFLIGILILAAVAVGYYQKGKRLE